MSKHLHRTRSLSRTQSGAGMGLFLHGYASTGGAFIATAAVVASLLLTPVFATSAMAQTPPSTSPSTNPGTGQEKQPKPADTDVRKSPGTTLQNRPTRNRQTPTDRAPAGLEAANPGQAAPGGAAPTQAPATTPALRFEPAVLDFGEMTAGVSITLKVKLINAVDKPVTVTRAVASCGCTIPTWPKDPIPVGGSAEAEVTLKPPEKQGTDLIKRVTFQLDGHAPVVLELKGHVTEYVKISPEIIDAPGKAALAAGGEGAKGGTVTLTSVDGTPFKILGANPPLVKDISAEAKTEHIVNIDWATWAESGKSPKLAFTTDHPKASNLSVIVKRALDDRPEPPTPPAAKAAAPASPVIQAVRAGDAATLRILIANGADVNAADPVSGGRTALHWAVKEGKKEIIPILLEAKANIEAKDRVGKTPLTVAAEGRDTEVVKMLVEKGADVNARDQIGGSPVLWASGLGSPDVVKYLIEKKADVNVVDVNGLSPLLWAAGIGSPESVEALVKAGAKVDVADKMSGDTAVMRAARTGKVESLKALLGAKPEVNGKNNLGHTPFMLAAMSGNVEKLEMLKAAGADVAAKDVRGWNALDYANNRIDAEKAKVVAYLAPIVPASGAAASQTPAAPKTTPVGGAEAPKPAAQ